MGQQQGHAPPRTRPVATAGVAVPRGGGAPAGVRAAMDGRFGWNFAQMRVHGDPRAAHAIAAPSAEALSGGHRLAAGSYATEGDRLLAHDLGPVVRRSRGAILPPVTGDPGLQSDASGAAVGASAGPHDHVAGELAEDLAGNSGASRSRIGGTATPPGECGCGSACEHGAAAETLPGASLGGGSSAGALASVREVLRTPGLPLDAATLGFMEPRFGHDFGHVRIHTDASAAASATALAANAYTVGNRIVFGAGRYTPDMAQGRRLLAHELAHVVQQGRGGAAPDRNSTLAIERDASAAGQAAVDGAPAIPVVAASGVGIARDTASELKADADQLYTSFLSSAWVPSAAKNFVESTNEGLKQKATELGITPERQKEIVASVVEAVGPDNVASATAALDPPNAPVATPSPAVAAAPAARGIHAPQASATSKRSYANVLPRAVRTISVQHFGLFGSGGYVIGQLGVPSIQYAPDPSAGVNFDTYIVVQDDNNRTIPAIWLGGTRYRVFMGSAECPGCHFGHGLEVDIGGENPIIATLPHLAGVLAPGAAGETELGAGAGARASQSLEPTLDIPGFDRSAFAPPPAWRAPPIEGPITVPASQFGETADVGGFTTVPGQAGGSFWTWRAPPDPFDVEFDAAFGRLESGQIPGQGALLGDLMFHGQRRAAVGQLRAQVDPNLRTRPGPNTNNAAVNPNPGYQSAHTTPQSTLRVLPSYNPDDMITRLLPTGRGQSHTLFDQNWQAQFRQIQQATGRTTTTAQELADVVARAARQSGAFSPAEAESVVQLIHEDLFVNLGLSPTQALRIPGT